MSGLAVTDRCPAYSAFFGVMGATSAMVFSGKSIKANNQILFKSVKIDFF